MRAVSSVNVECELDQRALDRKKVEALRRNRDGRAGLGRIGRPNRDRCMLVGKRGKSHDAGRGKRGADGPEANSLVFPPISSARLTLALRVFVQRRRDCLETDTAR